MVRLRNERRQKFGAGQTIDILLGRKTAKVIQHDHDQLKVFGIGTELNESGWRGVIRQLLAQGLVAVEGEYSTIVVTPAGDEVLYQGRQVPMRREPERLAKVKTAKAAKSAPVDLPAEAAPVFEKLRAWRTVQAREQGVPPYIIFNDATLRQIASSTPATLDELSAISGVGENKLAKYGQQILDTLSA